MDREFAQRLDRLASAAMPASLAAVVGWIGAMKFTAYEAAGIEPLVRHSPVLAWVYEILSVRGFSVALGVVELGIAALFVLGLRSPRLALAGGVAALGMFGTTLSFLLSTPGAWEPTLGGFPAVSAMPGQFLLKDLVLLAASVWVIADALRRMAAGSPAAR